MKNYTGTKTVNATPMTRLAYNELRNWNLPDDENGSDEGYLVEYTDGGKPNHADFDGYISWSPKEQFERAYVENTNTDMEREIQSKGKTAPRVTPADLQANIVDVETVKHVSVTGQVLRWAIITTRNGFAVTGDPSCAVSSENDDEQIGVAVAIENARRNLWSLMGYALKERLYQSTQPAQVPQATTRLQHLEAAAGHVSAANALQAGT